MAPRLVLVLVLVWVLPCWNCGIGVGIGMEVRIGIGIGIGIAIGIPTGIVCVSSIGIVLGGGHLITTNRLCLRSKANADERQAGLCK